jgi:hypothetical protein
MTTFICNLANGAYNKVEIFVNSHFAKIAFTIAGIALAYLAPTAFTFGVSIGLSFAVLYSSKGIMSTPMSATIALVGAVSSLVALTPAGQAGSKVFKLIPFLSSLSMGFDFIRMYGAKA